MKEEKEIDPVKVISQMGTMTCNDCGNEVRITAEKNSGGAYTGILNMSCDCGKELKYGPDMLKGKLANPKNEFEKLNWKFKVNLGGLPRILNMIKTAKKMKKEQSKAQ